MTKSHQLSLPDSDLYFIQSAAALAMSWLTDYLSVKRIDLAEAIGAIWHLMIQLIWRYNGKTMSSRYDDLLPKLIILRVEIYEPFCYCSLPPTALQTRSSLSNVILKAHVSLLTPSYLNSTYTLNGTWMDAQE